MTAALDGATDLFEHAPPGGLQRRFGLVARDRLSIGRRMLLVVLIGWLPLVVLTVMQRVALGIHGIDSLAWEVGAHARYLIAAPLLIFAESKCAFLLNAIVRNFTISGLVAGRDEARFEAAVASTRRLLRAPVAEIAVIVTAYAIVVASGASHPMDQVPAWHKLAGLSQSYSPAGWWHLLVSLPLLLVLVFGWLWRVVLWARLLWLISRLDLRLLASHPDHAGGLGFVGHSLGAFSIVALALMTIPAGRSAHLVLMGGTLPSENLFLNAGLLVAILAMFTAPVLVFSPMLLKTWQRGSLAYGGLTDKIGDAFERKWLAADSAADRSALEKPDFSAAADLYGIVANVHAMQLVPVGRKDLIALVVAMLIPFIPVVLLAVPVDTTLQSLKGLLL